jgi:molybdate transport system substrate-binding protein
MTNRRRLIAALAALALALPLPARAGDGVTVFAAASLKTALDQINSDWQAATGKKAVASYAGSSALAKQIEQGAPADVFISADLDWMTYLTGKGLVKADAAVNLLGNTLVLVAPTANMTPAAQIEPGFDLAAMLAGGKLAMADVKAVPAGKYGKAALENLKVWDKVEASVAQAENVRAALKLVATGEAAYGIVYQSDATAEPAVRLAGVFPAESHPAIIYPAAPLAAAQSPDTAAYLDYLKSAKARAVFAAQGFKVLTPAP